MKRNSKTDDFQGVGKRGVGAKESGVCEVETVDGRQPVSKHRAFKSAQQPPSVLGKQKQGPWQQKQGPDRKRLQLVGKTALLMLDKQKEGHKYMAGLILH